MMKPIDNDVRATDLSGGRNGEFLRGGLWRGRHVGSEPLVFQTPPRSMRWSPARFACAL